MPAAIGCSVIGGHDKAGICWQRAIDLIHCPVAPAGRFGILSGGRREAVLSGIGSTEVKYNEPISPGLHRLQPALQSSNIGISVALPGRAIDSPAAKALKPKFRAGHA